MIENQAGSQKKHMKIKKHRTKTIKRRKTTKSQAQEKRGRPRDILKPKPYSDGEGESQKDAKNTSRNQEVKDNKKAGSSIQRGNIFLTSPPTRKSLFNFELQTRLLKMRSLRGERKTKYEEKVTGSRTNSTGNIKGAKQNGVLKQQTLQEKVIKRQRQTKALHGKRGAPSSSHTNRRNDRVKDKEPQEFEKN